MKISEMSDELLSQRIATLLESEPTWKSYGRQDNFSVGGCWLEWYDLDGVIDRLRAEFVMGGHKAYQFARAMQHANLFVYSSLAPADIRKLKMQPLTSVAAIEELLAGSRRLAVLPQGTLSLARLAPAATIQTSRMDGDLTCPLY